MATRAAVAATAPVTAEAIAVKDEEVETLAKRLALAAKEATELRARFALNSALEQLEQQDERPAPASPEEKGQQS